MAPDVPLVVPEVNAHTLKEHKGIIAVPNCSALQMVTALQPIRKVFGLETNYRFNLSSCIGFWYSCDSRIKRTG